MKSRKIIFIVITCFMLLVFGGCNFTDKPLSLESNELRTASMFGGNNVDAENYNSLITEFQTQNKIKIKDVSSSSSETWKKMILRQFETGSEPDVVFFFNDATAQPLIDSNKVVSIAEIRVEYPSFASNIDETYLKDGYSVPIRTFAEGLFYNKDLFKDLKIEPPKTFSELIQIIDKINAKNLENPMLAKTPISLGASDAPHYMLESLLLMELGGEEYAKYPYENADDKINAKELYIKAFERLAELENKKAFGEGKSTEKSYDAAKNEFLSGNSYMFVDGSWLYPNSENHIPLDKIGVAPFPVKELKEEVITNDEGVELVKSNYGENIIAGCSSGYFISRKAWEDKSKREKAVKFVEFMTSDKSVQKFGVMTTLKENSTTSDNSIQGSFNKMIENSMNQYTPIDDRDFNFSFDHLVDGAKLVINEAGSEDFAQVLENIKENNIDKFMKG